MQLESRTILVDDLMRHSLFHAPPRSIGTKPLIVFLHGSNQNGSVMAEHWGDVGADGAFFLFPSALPSPGQDGNLETHWAATGNLNGVDPRQDVRFLAAQIGVLRAEYDWIGDVYLGGFSSGGKLVLDLLLSDDPADALYQGYAVCSRSLPPEWVNRTVTNPRSLISLIGDADGKGEWTGNGQALPAEETRDWLAGKLGLDPVQYDDETYYPLGGHPFLRRDYATFGGPVSFRWFRYHNGGHTFFSPPDYVPGAARQILRFYDIPE